MIEDSTHVLGRGHVEYLPFRQSSGQMQVSAAHLRHPRDASRGGSCIPAGEQNNACKCSCGGRLTESLTMSLQRRLRSQAQGQMVAKGLLMSLQGDGVSTSLVVMGIMHGMLHN